MNAEFMRALDALEAEKNIDKEELIDQRIRRYEYENFKSHSMWSNSKSCKN